VSTRTATDPWQGDQALHIPARRGELPAVCLLPGDPGRVDLAASVLRDFRLLGQNREFRLGVGTYDGVEIAICSTGIGGPSTEIAVVELCRLGVEVLIRVGGMGAIPAAIRPGDITVVTEALRDSGASRFYLRGDDPIVPADRSVVDALEEAGRALATPTVPIRVISCDAYYLGEGRPLPGWEDVAAARLDEVVARGADAMDMECETVFAVAAAMGARSGAVLATHGNRATDEWLDDYEPAQRRMLEVAAAAGATLSRR
jgi:uridine phosphorylase